jgi:hypothetical protein
LQLRWFAFAAKTTYLYSTRWPTAASVLAIEALSMAGCSGSMRGLQPCELKAMLLFVEDQKAGRSLLHERT